MKEAAHHYLHSIFIILPRINFLKCSASEGIVPEKFRQVSTAVCGGLLLKKTSIVIKIVYLRMNEVKLT